MRTLRGSRHQQGAELMAIIPAYLHSRKFAPTLVSPLLSNKGTIKNKGYGYSASSPCVSTALRRNGLFENRHRSEQDKWQQSTTLLSLLPCSLDYRLLMRIPCRASPHLLFAAATKRTPALVLLLYCSPTRAALSVRPLFH